MVMSYLEGCYSEDGYEQPRREMAWGGTLWLLSEEGCHQTSVEKDSLPPGIGEGVLRAPEEEGVERRFLHSAFTLLLQQL